MARLLEKYRTEVVPRLMKEFSYTNPLKVPRILKIVLNMGLGSATQDPKVIERAVEELGHIAGQRPAMRKARKSIAGFKLKEGTPIGVMVTLRGKRMWEFLDRLIYIALPRVKDFRGISPRGFDGRGNYNLGIREHIIFPEVRLDKMDRIKGMNITIVTSARTDKEAFALLKHLGMPFRAS
jgi:large subunit ribosomal protein L5